MAILYTNKSSWPWVPAVVASSNLHRTPITLYNNNTNNNLVRKQVNVAMSMGAMGGLE